MNSSRRTSVGTHRQLVVESVDFHRETGLFRFESVQQVCDVGVVTYFREIVFQDGRHEVKEDEVGLTLVDQRCDEMETEITLEKERNILFTARL